MPIETSDLRQIISQLSPDFCPDLDAGMRGELFNRSHNAWWQYVRNRETYIEGDVTSKEAYSKAVKFLDRRLELLDRSAPHFRFVAENISKNFSFVSLTTPEEGSAVQSGLTRYVHKGLLVSLDPELQEAWLNCHFSNGENCSQLMQIFGWSFNKMLKLQNDGKRTDIGFISRGTAGGGLAPYPMHTHIDVVLGLKRFDLIYSELAVALAACHDAFEEGSFMRFTKDAWTLEPVKLEKLINRFQENMRGLQLAVAVATLTETPYQEMRTDLSTEALYDYQSYTRQLVLNEYSSANIPLDQISKIHFQDPFVFGGLASQVKEVISVLCDRERSAKLHSKLSPQQIAELKEAIVAVEIADRLSDIASIGRHIEYYSAQPDLGRYKTLAYISRMLNMQEKLSDSVAYLSEDKQDNFHSALSGYLYVLSIMVDRANKKLEEQGLQAMDFLEIERFYNKVFKPSQNMAESIMSEFISKKAEEIVGVGE